MTPIVRLWSRNNRPNYCGASVGSPLRKWMDELCIPHVGSAVVAPFFTTFFFSKL